MIGEDISPTTRISREELRELQWRRLQPQIAYNYAKSPFYRERFDAIGLQPADIRAWDDFQRVPIMDKHDHREAPEESIRRCGHPFGMLCCLPTASFTLAPPNLKTFIAQPSSSIAPVQANRSATLSKNSIRTGHKNEWHPCSNRAPARACRCNSFPPRMRRTA